MKKRIISIVLVIVMIFAADVLHAAAVPLDIPECTCGSSGELVVSHSDDCTLKNYYVSFCNDTAENIFADWAFLPEDGREYILLFLSENDNEKYNKLLALLEELQNSRTVVFEAEDKSVSVYAADNAFPDGTTITTQELTVSEEQQNAVMNAVNGISADITVHGFCATDITFRTENGEEVQPNQPVSMKMKLNQSDSLSSANTVIVLHEGENGLELVDEVPIDGENTQSVAVAASGFSSYYNVLVSVADNDRSLTKLYNNNSGSSGTAKATDFYAYIGFTNSTNNKKYLITYDKNATEDDIPQGYESFQSEWRVRNRVIGREISDSYLSNAVDDDLWHFQLETAESFGDIPVTNSYRITHVGTGLSLDLYGQDVRADQPIDLYTDTGNAASQRWFVEFDSTSGKYRIKLASNQSFAIHAFGGFAATFSDNGQIKDNVVLHAVTADGSDTNEFFDIILDPDSKNTITSLYQEEGKTALSGTVSALSDFNQRLGVTTATDFYAYITANGKCLTYTEKGYGNQYNLLSISDKTPEQCATLSDKNNYLWHFTIETNDRDQRNLANVKNSYKIVNVGKGEAIDLSNSHYYDDNNVLRPSTSQNVPILTGSPHGIWNQRWFINCVNDSSGNKMFTFASPLDTQGTGTNYLHIAQDGESTYPIILSNKSENNLFNITLDPASKNTISSLYQEEGKTSLSGTVSALSDFYAYISYNDHLLTYKTFEGDSVSDRLIVSSKTADECKSNKEYYKKYLWHFTAETANELKWTDNSKQSITTKIGGSYKISNVGANEEYSAIHPLDDQLHGTANNTPVTLCSVDNDNAAQRWFITYDTMYHKFAIHTSHNLNAVLDAQSGGTNDTIVDIYTNGDGYTANQRFDIILADTSEYQSSLMSDLLSNNPDYSVEGIGNVNLFNYDPIEFNNSETGSSLAFDGYQKYLSDFDEYNSDMYGSGTVKSYIDNNVNFYAYISFSTGGITRRIYYGEQTCYLGPDRITEADKDKYLWQFICQPDGSYAIKYKYNNKWLTINKKITTETNASENFRLSDSLDDPTQNSYWKLEYLTDNGEEKFRFLPKTKGMEGFAMDVSNGYNTENNTVNAFKNGAVVNSYMSIEPQQMADPVNAGDHFYAYIAYRPENTSAWMSHKLYDTIDRFAVGDGANLNNEYLWEFVRTGKTSVYASGGSTTTVTGLENSYEIVSVADPTKCIDLQDGDLTAGKPINRYIRNNTQAQRWFIKYCAEFDRFYLASAIDQSYFIDVYQGGTGAGTVTSIQKNTTDKYFRSCKQFDLLLVNGQTGFGVSSGNTGGEAKYLSESSGYLENGKDDIATPGDRFYANIAWRPDDTYTWLTHKDNFTHPKYNGTAFDGGEVTYHGLVVGSGENYTSDANYLWEFIREESGEYENAYRIVCAAQPELCLEAYEATAEDGNFVSLSPQRSAEDTNRKAQLWYIKYSEFYNSYTGKTYKRFGLISAANTVFGMDVRRGDKTAGTAVILWTFENGPINRIFDLRIVTDVSAYGLNSVTSSLVDYNLRSSGYPVITGSNVTGEELFNPSVTHAGKTTVATNAKMQFIYNKSTGYYEYKSTANHAQYNKATNTIEQYADTLGNYNYSSYDIPITASNYLDTSQTSNSKISLTRENGMLVGSVTERGPYIAFKNLNIQAYKARYIYVKAYIGSNTVKDDSFIVYFKRASDTHYSEVRKFLKNYKNLNKSGWYEFVFDTATSPYWDGTITGLRVDFGYEFIDVSASNPYTVKLAQVSIISGETVQKIDPETYTQQESYNGISSIAADALFKYEGTDIPPAPWRIITAKVSGNDPQIQYNNLNINAAEVKGIVIQAKIPRDIIKNAFQLYFANGDGEEFSKDKKFTVFYDKSQIREDCYQLYFDLSKVDKYNSGDKWTGTIKKLRLDPLDFSDNDLKSSIYPQAFTDEFDIKIAAISFVGESNTADSAGAFLPLADIADSTAGQGNGFLKGSWESELNNTSVTNTAASRAIVNGEPQSTDINKSRSEVIKRISPTSYDKDSLYHKHIINPVGNSDGSLTFTVDNSIESAKSDPGLDYRGLNINASDVKGIRIKAKIPAAKINENLFQVFFVRPSDPGYEGDKVFTAVFNKAQLGADGYYELYFDTSKSDGENNFGNNWNGTISGIRLDPVDFQGNENRNPTTCPADLMITIKSIELIGCNDHIEEEQESYDSLYFGMTMEHKFYLPTNKHDDKGKPIEFEYIGDDDLWVFIDGVLALDLGGCHTAQHGKISFTDGKVYVNGGSGTALSSKILETNKEHTLKLFYLERSGSTSSMMIRFNLPQSSLTVENTDIKCNNYDNLTESQQKRYDDNKQKGADNNEVMTYEITANSASGTPLDTTLYYTIGDGAAKTVTVKGGVGTFDLKEGETAAFTVPAGYSIKVEPKAKKIDKFAYSNTVSISKHEKPADPVTVTGQTQSTAQNTLLAYAFTNTYALQVTDLTIEKPVSNPSEDPNRTFIYRIKGTDDTTAHIDTRVMVNMGQKEKQDQLINLNAVDWDPHIVIRAENTFSGVNSDDLLNITINVSGIPVGQEAMIYYRTDNSGALGDDQTIRVIKTDASDELVFNVKNVISKNEHSGIIQELRFDPMRFTSESSVNVNLKINFVTFNFADGTSKVFDTRTFAGFKECFVLNSEDTSGDVGNHMRYSVTPGDITVNTGSVKINDLPLGNYTVTEEQSWAWRHPLGNVVLNSNGNTSEQTVTNNGVNILLEEPADYLLTFNNNTTYNKWMDGSSYNQNVFTQQ